VHYNALQQLTHDRRDALAGQARTERLARETRGRRHARRRRLTLDAARELLAGTRGHTARA
jgi:hypothetical protein